MRTAFAGCAQYSGMMRAVVDVVVLLSDLEPSKRRGGGVLLLPVKSGHCGRGNCRAFWGICGMARMYSGLGVPRGTFLCPTRCLMIFQGIYVAPRAAFRRSAAVHRCGCPARFTPPILSGEPQCKWRWRSGLWLGDIAHGRSVPLHRHLSVRCVGKFCTLHTHDAAC